MPTGFVHSRMATVPTDSQATTLPTSQAASLPSDSQATSLPTDSQGDLCNSWVEVRVIPAKASSSQSLTTGETQCSTTGGGKKGLEGDAPKRLK